MSKEELIKELSNKITRDELVRQIAELVATDKVEDLEKKLKKLPNTILLKEEYKHPETPQCRGCPHPEGRYVHPSEPVCDLPRYEHPEEQQCKHDHSAERINPLYCSLRTITKVKEAADVDKTNIGNDKILVYKSASKAHEYEDQSCEVHGLGGAKHSADTLANLNSKVSDATLDDSSGTCARTPPSTVFLKDGSVAMTGNLDMAANWILWTNTLINEGANDSLWIRNRENTSFRKLGLSRLLAMDYCLFGSAVEGDIDTDYCVNIRADQHSAIHPIKVVGSRTPSGNIAFRVVNNTSAHVNNKAVFDALCMTSGAGAPSTGRAAFAFYASFSTINDATRQSLVEFKAAHGGSFTQVMLFDGKEITIPDLAGAGNDYVYVDANGKLKRSTGEYGTSGNFTTVDGKTVTVTDGIITSIV